MKLTWSQGKPVNGQTYYAEAATGQSKLTICRYNVSDVAVYSLWKDKTFIKDFWPKHGGKKAAVEHAEEIARERNSNQAT